MCAGPSKGYPKHLMDFAASQKQFGSVNNPRQFERNVIFSWEFVKRSTKFCIQTIKLWSKTTCHCLLCYRYSNFVQRNLSRTIVPQNVSQGSPAWTRIERVNEDTYWRRGWVWFKGIATGAAKIYSLRTVRFFIMFWPMYKIDWHLPCGT